jgi:hypothetical protein
MSAIELGLTFGFTILARGTSVTTRRLLGVSRLYHGRGVVTVSWPDGRKDVVVP